MKKLKLSFLCVFVAALCCAVAAFVSIHFISEAQKYIDQPDTSTEISAPERETTATAVTIISAPIFVSNNNTTTGVSISGNTATITWSSGLTRVLVGMTGYNSSQMSATAVSGPWNFAMPAATGAPACLETGVPGTYTFTITAASGYGFSTSGTTSVTYKLVIEKISYDIPIFVANNNTTTGVTISGDTSAKVAWANQLYITIGMTGYNETIMNVAANSGTWAFSMPAATGAPAVLRNPVAGSFSFTVTLDKDSKYYMFSTGDITVTYTLQVTARSIKIHATAATVSNQTYKGSAYTPTPTVTDSELSYTLVEGTDYEYSYENNVDAGTATITIKGIGGYSSSISVTFTINPRNISNAMFGKIAEQTYNNGIEIKPTPMITDSGISKTLTSGTDFTFSYANNINAGSATITITGTGNYTGTKSTNFTISGISVANATFGTPDNYTYDGTAKKPTVTVVLNDVTLSSSTDFTFSWSNNINAGTATLTITGKGNYSGTASKEFTIEARNISLATVAAVADQAYTGSAKTPLPTITDLNRTLTRNTDYTLSYEDNTDIGTAKIIITGKGNYTGEVEAFFSITQRNISSVTVAAIGTYYYDGAAKEPTPAVTDGGKTLVEGTDFTYSYRNNVDVGTAVVILTGMGNYTGTKEVSFSIQPPTIDAATVTLSQTEYTYDGTAKEPRVTSVQIGDLALSEGVNFTVSYTSNVNAGTAKVVLTGIGDYAGTKEVTFTINPADMSDATINGLLLTYTYTGKPIEPSVTVTLGDKTLVLNTDYLITYENNIDKGTATVTVTGSKNYTGTLTDSFTIVAANINNANIAEIKSQEYTGEAIEVLPVITCGGLQLVKDKDYTLAYSNNEEIGTATVTVTGIGNYTGSKEGTFEIIKAMPKVSVSYEGWNGTDPLFAGNALPKITATATYNGAVVDGTIAWDGDGGLSEGENSYGWTFTPDDTEHYEVVTGNASLSSKTPTYIAIRAEWKGETQPELFTSSSVSVIKANLKVTGISDDSSTSEIVGGYSFEIVDKNGATTVNGMPTAGGTDFKIIVKFGEWQDTIYSVEIKNVELTELSVEAAEGGIETEYTALDKFDTSSVVVTAKYNDGTEKTVVYGKGGYSVVYEQGTEYLQYDDTKVTLMYTEKGITKTAVIEDLSVSKKGLDEELVFDPDDADYDFGNSLAGGIKVENLPDWLKVTYIYKNEAGNEIAAADVKNAGTYTVTATFTVDKNHKEVDDITATFKINAIEPTITPAVGGSFTAGTALNDLTISGNAEAVAGTLTWDEETYQLKAGTNRCYYTFTPDDTVNFKTVQGYVDIEVDNAPTATGTDGIAGWQIALIIICLLIAIVAIIALIIALKQRKTTTDNDGFYDDVTDADLM